MLKEISCCLFEIKKRHYKIIATTICLPMNFKNMLWDEVVSPALIKRRKDNTFVRILLIKPVKNQGKK